MSLFEASWPDGSSYLLSTYSMGHAIYLIQKEVGARRLYDLSEISEIGQENFILIRRCGLIRQPIHSISFQHCPNASPRIFFVQYSKNPEQAVFVVESVAELPSLVLPHYSLLKESHAKNKELAFTEWKEHCSKFSVVELDTQKNGILLHYDYCCCHKPKSQPSLTHQDGEALEKPH